MRWVVRVWNAIGSTLLTEFENGARTTDGEIVLRGFDPATVTPPGASKNLNLYARQDRALIPPRAIVQLVLDGTPVFWGPAIIVPPDASRGAGPFDRDRDSLERITVTGGEQLLRDSVVGPRLFAGDTDVATIAYELCSLYAHPALTVDALNFPATGGVLSIYYSPEKDLWTALAELAETVPGGADAWVDADGAVRFEARGGS